MNQHTRSLFTLPTRAWSGFVSLFSITLLVCLLASATQVKAQQPTWSQTGSLGTARSLHTATLLANGKVLVVGGFIPGGQVTASAELYDQATGQWSATGSPSTRRVNHVAARLQNGKVLIASGGDGTFGTALTSAELYDPDTGTWSAAGNLSVQRGSPRATLLADGRVLAVGGSASPTAEVYDPATNAWSPTGTMNSVRIIHTVTLLSDGRVLVAGGNSSTSTLRSAELFNPATNNWTLTGQLINARQVHAATFLPNGQVLVSGGAPSSGPFLAQAELYDPATGQWSATGSMTTTRVLHTLTVLANGKVLASSGAAAEFPVPRLKSAELYDPATGSWAPTAELSVGRTNHTATLLQNGKVLVAGGSGDAGQITIAELFDSGLPGNPIDDPEFFVRRHYGDFFNREADPAGLAFWIAEITSCGPDQPCVQDRRINVSAAFFISIEFQNTGYFVFRFERASFGRLPRAASFLSDLQRTGAGVVVGQPGWEAQLEANKQAFNSEWVQRAEFVARYPNTLSAVQYVDALFANAEVVPTQAEREAAVAAYGNGDTQGRASALRSVVETGSVYNKQYNPAFVLMQYFGYLRRNPNDPPDTDFAGYNFWLTKLNEFSQPGEDVRNEVVALSRVKRAEMVKAFITSGEYRGRFGSQ